LHDPNLHVRRWISEGTRPRLPWGAQLTAFIRDPAPTLDLLEHLKDDPSAYVRKSVANHLNDITKDHPARVIEVAERWLQGASAERRWIVTHALRTLVKKGDAAALALLGYGTAAALQVPRFSVTPTSATLGDTVTMTLSLTNQSAQTEQVVIDYRLHYVKANGKTSPKVFKWTTRTLAAHETITLEKNHLLRDVTTRTHYSGQHTLDIQVNGQVLAATQFSLTVPPRVG
jgi:3-methyladenine DNA glycosylase AlkC